MRVVLFWFLGSLVVLGSMQFLMFQRGLFLIILTGVDDLYFGLFELMVGLIYLDLPILPPRST